MLANAPNNIALFSLLHNSRVRARYLGSDFQRLLVSPPGAIFYRGLNVHDGEESAGAILKELINLLSSLKTSQGKLVSLVVGANHLPQCKWAYQHVQELVAGFMSAAVPLWSRRPQGCCKLTQEYVLEKDRIHDELQRSNVENKQLAQKLELAAEKQKENQLDLKTTIQELQAELLESEGASVLALGKSRAAHQQLEAEVSEAQRESMRAQEELEQVQLRLDESTLSIQKLEAQLLEARSDGEDARASIRQLEAEVRKGKGEGEAVVNELTQRLQESEKARDRALRDAEDSRESNKIVKELEGVTACLKEELLSLARGSKDAGEKVDSPKVGRKRSLHEENLSIKKRKGKGPVYVRRIPIECNKLRGTLVVKKDMESRQTVAEVEGCQCESCGGKGESLAVGEFELKHAGSKARKWVTSFKAVCKDGALLSLKDVLDLEPFRIVNRRGCKRQ
ncbi:hypothetical protein KFL_010390010 [Klebsormidium nitens]|uniref:Uncharacterized protein n=1 Tax=Klebsormidium nitens TaxID=105231 RepID=A0A1Y1INS2_KLENI|nr:hypothetical protein KFL_010390010 [Klebsormidium nitens]|eukprot:GAQ92520.1 hypothetical protein KFL_010390010 [Klebsormidium nitens]